jgi:hypothetical protein
MFSRNIIGKPPEHFKRYFAVRVKIFAAIRFVDAHGTKNPYQNSMSL